MKHPHSLLLTVIVTVMVPVLSARGAGSVAGTTDSPASIPVLLGLEPVRQDLKVTSLQEVLLDSLRAEYKAKVGVVAAVGLADSKAAPRAAADLEAFRIRYNQRAVAVLNPVQQQRLRQIERQMLGGSLLTSPSEQKLLGLSPKQQKTLGEIHRHDLAEAAEIMGRFHAGKITSFHKDIDLHRNQRTTSRSMLAVLTPAQKEQWLGLTGPKLKL